MSVGQQSSVYDRKSYHAFVAYLTMTTSRVHITVGVPQGVWDWALLHYRAVSMVLCECLLVTGTFETSILPFTYSITRVYKACKQMTLILSFLQEVMSPGSLLTKLHAHNQVTSLTYLLLEHSLAYD